MSKQVLPTHDMMNVIISALDNHQPVQFKVSGTSMLPFFKHQKTTVELTHFSDFQKHEVVLFKYQDTYRLHRIIKISKNQVILRGDNTYKKEMIHPKMILGVVNTYQTRHKPIKIRSFQHRFKYHIWLIIKPFVLLSRRIHGQIKTKRV